MRLGILLFATTGNVYAACSVLTPSDNPTAAEIAGAVRSVWGETDPIATAYAYLGPSKSIAYNSRP